MARAWALRLGVLLGALPTPFLKASGGEDVRRLHEIAALAPWAIVVLSPEPGAK